VGAGLADVAGAHWLREPGKFQRGADVAGAHWLREQKKGPGKSPRGADVAGAHWLPGNVKKKDKKRTFSLRSLLLPSFLCTYTLLALRHFYVCVSCDPPHSPSCNHSLPFPSSRSRALIIHRSSHGDPCLFCTVRETLQQVLCSASPGYTTIHGRHHRQQLVPGEAGGQQAEAGHELRARAPPQAPAHHLRPPASPAPASRGSFSPARRPQTEYEACAERRLCNHQWRGRYYSRLWLSQANQSGRCPAALDSEARVQIALPIALPSDGSEDEYARAGHVYCYEDEAGAAHEARP
jgi:hypothetical protein